jgi:hypothetical protein
MGYRYQDVDESAIKTVPVYEDESDIRNSRPPQIQGELDMIEKSSVELRVMLSQLEERLSDVLRPQIQAGGISVTNSVGYGEKDVPEPVCRMAGRVRQSRMLVDEARRKVRSMLSLLEI